MEALDETPSLLRKAFVIHHKEKGYEPDALDLQVATLTSEGKLALCPPAVVMAAHRLATQDFGEVASDAKTHVKKYLDELGIVPPWEGGNIERTADRIRVDFVAPKSQGAGDQDSPPENAGPDRNLTLRLKALQARDRE